MCNKAEQSKIDIKNVGALRNPSIFSNVTISCPLNVTLSSLLFARVEVCVLEDFGMKADMDLLEKLAEM